MVNVGMPLAVFIESKNAQDNIDFQVWERERPRSHKKLNKMAMRTLPLPGKKTTCEFNIGSDNVLIITKWFQPEK